MQGRPDSSARESGTLSGDAAGEGAGPSGGTHRDDDFLMALLGARPRPPAHSHGRAGGWRQLNHSSWPGAEQLG